MQDDTEITAANFAVFRAQIVSIFNKAADGMAAKANGEPCPMRSLQWFEEAGKLRNVARSMKDMTYKQIAPYIAQIKREEALEKVILDAAE